MIKIAGIALFKLLKRVAVGAVVDTAKVVVAAPVKAVAEEVKNVITDNIESEEGGVGKPDYVRLVSSIASILFGVAYVLGYITLDQLKQIATIIFPFIF